MIVNNVIFVVLDLMNREEMKVLLAVTISSGVEKMMLMIKMVLSSDRGERLLV